MPFSYTQTGQLVHPMFAAAGALGGGGGSDSPSMMDVLNFNARQKSEGQQAQMDAQRLQLAHQQLVNRGQTPTQTSNLGGKSLIGQTMTKTNLRKALLGDEAPTGYDALEKDPGLSTQQYEQILRQTQQDSAAAEKQQAATAKSESEMKAKWDFAHSLIGTVTEPEMQAQFRQIVNDPKATVQDLQNAAVKYRAIKANEQQTQDKQAQARREDQLRADLAQKKLALEDSHKALVAAGVTHGDTAHEDRRNLTVENLANAPAADVVQALASNPSLQKRSTNPWFGEPVTTEAPAHNALMAYRRAKAEYDATAAQLGQGPQAQQQAQQQAQPQQAAPQQGQYQMGQVISTPKGNVKIVGFDTDGHPLIEPQ